MDEQTKQIVGIGVGVGVAVGSILGYHYYLKSKTGFGFEKLPKLLKARWQNIDSEYEEIDGYQTDDRPILSKLKDAVVNKLYPQDYNKLPRKEQELIENIEKFRITQSRNRKRFTVYDSNRFQVLETMGDKGVETRGTNRFRVSGNIHKRTEGGYGRSGYDRNNRNANFSDLEIPNNQPRDYKNIW